MRTRRRLTAAILLLLLLLIIIVVVVILTQNNEEDPPAPTEAPTPTEVSFGAPTGLTAIPGNTVITLNWDESSAAAGYLVYRDESEIPLNPEPLTVLAYQDIGLTNGRLYRYVVVAVDFAGELSDPSEAVEAAPRSE